MAIRTTDQRYACDVEQTILLDMMSRDKMLPIIAQHPEQYCRTVKIPKRSGGKRELIIGNDAVRKLETLYYPLLKNYLSTVVNEKNMRHCVMPCHSFMSGRSVATAVQEAIRVKSRRRTVIRMDLKNFFPSIKTPNLIDAFKSMVEANGYAKLLLGGTAQFESLWETYIHAVTPNGAVAQGYMSAPILSNIYMMDVDEKIWAALIECCGITVYRGPTCEQSEVMALFGRKVFQNDKDISKVMNYIRYCDDLYIILDESLKVDTKGIHDALRSVLEVYGLSINENKTTVTDSHRQQRVLGVVMNSNLPRVPKEKREALREKILRKNGPLFNSSGTCFLDRRLGGQVEYALMASNYTDRRLISAVLKRLNTHDRPPLMPGCKLSMRYRQLYMRASEEIGKICHDPHHDIDLRGMF